MLNLQRALENDHLLRALTGLNRKAFAALCEVFSRVYQKSLENDPKPRKRASGEGRKARLRSMESKLFFILFYFKCYPTFDVLSSLFELVRGRVRLWVHRLQELLEAALGRKLVCPNANWKVWSSFSNGFPMSRK